MGVLKWSTEQTFARYKHIMHVCFKEASAIRNYADDTGDDMCLSDMAFDILKDIKQNQNNYTEKELLEKSNFVLERFNNLIAEIGKDHFIFYDDGDVEYSQDSK